MGFLNDITFGQYLPRESFVHRLDPRSKLLAALLISTSLLISHRFETQVLLACVGGIGIGLARLPFALVARNLRPFFWLFLITFAIHAFTRGGEAMVTVPGLGWTVTREGVAQGGLYTLRLAFLIVFATLLTLTTSPIELMDGLERLLAPLKRVRVPVQELTLMMSLSLRFIPIMLREAQRIKHAQQSRGAALEGSLLTRLRNLVPMLLPLFVSAFRRADELAVAMEARNYRVGVARSHFRRRVFGPADGLVVGTAAGLFVAGLWRG